MHAASRHIECTIPILPVRSLSESIRFYTETLGFQLDWGGEPGSMICSVSRDGCCIMLTETSEPSPGVWVWVGLDDDSLFQVFQDRGVKVRQPPQNHPWAYEMKFEDPDGNVLWMGTEPKEPRS